MPGCFGILYMVDIYLTLYCFMESFSTICGLKSDILHPGSELSQKKLQACWGIRTCSNCSSEGLQLERQSNNQNHFTCSVTHLILVVQCLSVSFILQKRKRLRPCVHHFFSPATRRVLDSLGFCRVARQVSQRCQATATRMQATSWRLAKVFDGTSIHIRSPHLPKLPSQCTIPIWSIGYHHVSPKRWMVNV
jgi:hypothetical protein